jgi:hypothetical protein
MSIRNVVSQKKIPDKDEKRRGNVRMESDECVTYREIKHVHRILFQAICESITVVSSDGREELFVLRNIW